MRRSLSHRATVCLMALTLSIFNLSAYAASEHRGHVTFNDLPVPGATITASQGDKHMTKVTDAQGNYQFPMLDDGSWTLQVEMRGFETQTREITVGADVSNMAWDL